ncbi:NAD-dependent epimerase/dehydratase family protein [Leuconostoc mesenteroides]|uniref:NAD-dependent epimerase/dehydratase family protein n=1 Tax=Leuconostoc mesenteroides TaxID=1245 RepID=UPI000A004A03|nr:NAD-dependent epimerase/dehydratase family protein [Leuconostoc mesenteroides]ORI78729.1 epimerase [Leuconostoc mesenteroides subsp. mesenteroides]
MKILVTGGAGFIGSHVVEEHIKNGDEVVVVDDLSMGTVKNLPNSELITFYENNITNFEFIDNLLINGSFDVVFLLAAVASVADTIQRPLVTHEVNQQANVHILETIRLHSLGVKKIIFASSAAVYGTLPVLPKIESGAVDPATPYAIDKYATERFVRAYNSLYGIPTVVFRFFNVYGPRQNPKSPYSGVLSLISNALANNETFTVMGDGQQTRDFVFVKDVVQALMIGELTDEMNGQVFNVGSGKTNTLLTAIEAFQDISGKKLTVKFADERQGDIKRSAANINKLEQFGYDPKYDFSTGVEKYWESLKG